MLFFRIKCHHYFAIPTGRSGNLLFLQPSKVAPAEQSVIVQQIKKGADLWNKPETQLTHPHRVIV